MKDYIPFNRQNFFGNELKYIEEAYNFGKVSGDGFFTKKCSEYIEKEFGIGKALLTTSCTHALELASLLIDLKKGDEVILPSYTFVSTVNAIVLRGATPVFCDIRRDNLNIDETLIENLISEKTKAIYVVHYAGVACEMNRIMEIAKKYNLWVVEDAAQAINSKFEDKYLGSIGHLATFSFHETKNISCGEGGALLINDDKFIERAEILREKGTNRSKFFRGQVDKYSWVDVGSSYLLSEINAAVLWAQLEKLNKIQSKRKKIYQYYFEELKTLHQDGRIVLPKINSFSTSNYHLFHILLDRELTRDKLMYFLKSKGIIAVFHYLPLHKSEYYEKQFGILSLKNTEELSQRLLRLPIYYGLGIDELNYIVLSIKDFFKEN